MGNEKVKVKVDGTPIEVLGKKVNLARFKTRKEIQTLIEAAREEANKKLVADRAEQQAEGG